MLAGEIEDAYARDAKRDPDPLAMSCLAELILRRAGQQVGYTTKELAARVAALEAK